MANQFVTRQIADDAITYAKLQNVAAARLLGRATTGIGDVEEIILGTNLSFTGTILNAVNSGGTVTTVSVVSANGFAGTVATNSTTPAITLSTTISGLLKGNGTAISAAVANTDYLTPAYTGFDGRYLQLAGGSMTGFITLHADPTSAMHAATKQYVDAQGTGLSWKNPARVATTGDITLSGTQTIDGVAVIVGDRVLVKNQTTASQNGIYIVAAGAWTRALDADSAIELDAATVMVEYGSQANTQWTENATVVTIGTDTVTFVQISGTGTYTNGTGISLSGNQFSFDTVFGDARYVIVGRNLTINGSTQTLATDRTFTITTTGTAGRIAVSGGTGLTPTIDLVSGIVTPGTGFNTFSVDTYGRVTAASNTSYLTANQTITLSGDVTGSGTTAITTSILSSVVTGKLLTGYSASAGTVVAGDTILQAFNKLGGNQALYLLSSRYIARENFGTPNGSTTGFNLANTPLTGKEMIFINGQLQNYTENYTISGTTVTFTVAPETGGILLATYIY